ncbi:hypothetical protein MMG00_03335 [Ignatzschineria rhizosphaerae]|uniref:Uncharacterized protein n=1 Tax=Ignatzschineria rhizosphaerae TaxID=2923279 RepID=A0ABY3X1Y7_9GAMM|nr:hypothetical protein [Ignatzschineria rhizosphaerae]UNM96898.1 hypothetical protein MMG00_03335 [Ignatzschineria rhizosphaerae]
MMIKKQPIDRNGHLVNVGSSLMRNQEWDTIIRIDENTEQVWYKKGGFNWFEEMKNFVQFS